MVGQLVLGQWILGMTLWGCLSVGSVGAQDVSSTDLDKSIQQAIRFLQSQQADNGMIAAEMGPGITALAVTGALRCGESAESPWIAKALAAVETYVKPDGGIYGNGRLKNYETCIAIICFVEANQAGRYNALLDKAKKFVTSLQYGVGNAPDHAQWDGGATYGGQGRPDLSNTVYLVEALHALDAGANDPHVQAALAFISRCQNLDSPHNPTPFAAKIGDGSFYYEIPTESIDPTTDPERYTPNGGIRGYGSMTYAAYKSMIYAGLTEADPRVAAALRWIKETYTVDANPNMGEAGLYFYYQTFGTALRAAGVDQVVDSQGTARNWRLDLATALQKRQAADGSWSNTNRRWLENEKALATSFALLALANCRPPADSK
jgi:squalene-hopene/tetraprenyl-beta-curcumene cyclase